MFSKNDNLSVKPDISDLDSNSIEDVNKMSGEYVQQNNNINTTETDGMEIQSNTSDQSLKEYLSGVCLCSICPEHPLFAGEEEYLIHFNKYHQRENENDILNETIGDGLNNSKYTEESCEVSTRQMDDSTSGKNVTPVEVLVCTYCKHETYFLNKKQLSAHVQKYHKNKNKATFAKKKPDDESDTISSFSLSDDITEYPSGACLCSICPEHPLFSGEEEFMDHFHKLHGRKNKQDSIIGKIDDVIGKSKLNSKQHVFSSVYQGKDVVSRQSISLMDQSIDVVSKPNAKKSLENLAQRLSLVKKEHNRFEIEKESLEDDLSNFRINVKKSGSYIEEILQREIDELTTCKNEQFTLMSEIQKSINDLKVINTGDNSGDNSARNLRITNESDVKVSKWLQQHSDMVASGFVFQDTEKENKTVQAQPEVFEKSIQTCPEWMEEQEKKEQLLKNMQMEKESLTSVLQHKSMCLQELEHKLEGLRRTESQVSKLEDTLEEVRSQSKLEMDAQVTKSGRKLKTMEFEKEGLNRKLKEYSKLIKDFKTETKNLQSLCQNIRSDASKEKIAYEKTLEENCNELREKSMLVGDLQDQVQVLTEHNKESKQIQNTLERRKAQLCLDIEELKGTMVTLKDEKLALSSKVLSAKSIIREKTKTFNEKIDSFLNNEKLLKIEINKLTTKTKEKDDLIKNQDTKIQIMKREVKDVKDLKRRYHDQMDELKEAVTQSEKNREIISEKFISLEEKHKNLWQDHIKLEERSKCQWNSRNAEAEATKREIQKLKDENFELRQQYDSVYREHEYCSKKKEELERNSKYKECKLRDEMEMVLKDSSTEYQKQIEILKEELRKFERKEIMQDELEAKIGKLTQKNRKLNEELETSISSGIEEKKRFNDEFTKLDHMVATLEKKKEKLISEKAFFKEKAESFEVEVKEKQVDKKKEIQYYKDELLNVRQHLHEQLLVVKQLQEERQDGGLPWQYERRDLQKELEISKNKIRDCEINEIILQEKCSKLTREAQAMLEKRDLTEKGLREQIEQEKRNCQKYQVECARDTEIWIKKYHDLEKTKNEIAEELKSVKMECDLKHTKWETSEQMSRNESENLRLKFSKIVSIKEKLEKDNRELSGTVTSQEEQLNSLKKEFNSQARYLENVDIKLDENECVRAKLKNENIKLSEKLRQMEYRYEKANMELARNSTKFQKIEHLEEENENLKRELNDTKIELNKFKGELKMVEKEKVCLDKQYKLSENRQYKMQKHIDNLQQKLKTTFESTQDELTTAQDQNTKLQYTYETELQKKVEKITHLEQLLRTFEQNLTKSKSAQYKTEVNVLRDNQSQMSRMTQIHENEIKTKDIAITLLKRELNERKEKLSQLSEENTSSYENEINELVAKHTGEIQDLENQNKRLRREVAKLKKLVREVSDQSTKDQFESISSNYIKDLKSRDQVIIQLNQKIASLKELVDESSIIRYEKEELLTNQLQSHDELTNNDDRDVQSHEKLVKSLHAQVAKLVANNNEEKQSRDEMIRSLKAQTLSLNDMAKVTDDGRIEELLSNHQNEIKSRDELIRSLKEMITSMKNAAKKENLIDENQLEELLANHNEEIRSRDELIEFLKVKTTSMRDATKVKVNDDKKIDFFLANHKERIQSRDEKIIHLKKKISELKSFIEEIEADHTKTVDEMNADQEIKLDARDEKMTELKKKIADLTEAIKKQTHSDELEANHDAKIKTRDRQVVALRNKMEELKRSMEERLIVARQEAETLQGELQLKESDMKELQKKLEQRTVARGNNAHVKQLKRTVEELASENIILSKKITEIQNELKLQKKDDAKLQMRIEELSNERDAIIKEKNHLAEKVTVLLQKLNFSESDAIDEETSRKIKIEDKILTKNDKKEQTSILKKDDDDDNKSSNDHNNIINDKSLIATDVVDTSSEHIDTKMSGDTVDNDSWDSSDDEDSNENNKADDVANNDKTNLPTSKIINVDPAAPSSRVINVAPAAPSSKVINVAPAAPSSRVINVAPAAPSSKVINVAPAAPSSKVINVAPAAPSSKVINVASAAPSSKVINVAPATLPSKVINVTSAASIVMKDTKSTPLKNDVHVTLSNQDTKRNAENVDEFDFDFDDTCHSDEEESDEKDDGSLDDLLEGLDKIDSNRNKL